MDQIFNKLHHVYSKHKKALQGLVSKVQALCEEAESLKDKISDIPNGNNLPTAQLEAVNTEAEQVLRKKYMRLIRPSRQKKDLVPSTI